MSNCDVEQITRDSDEWQTIKYNELNIIFKLKRLKDFLDKICSWVSDEIKNSIVSDLIYNYSHSTRYYHTLKNHIFPCLLELEHIRGLINNNHRFEFALWYHDYYYIPGSQFNEQYSADKAIQDCKRLELNQNFSTNVRLLILAKRKAEFSFLKQIPHDHKLFIDLDHSIFGQDEEKYNNYVYCLREEYKFFDIYSINRPLFLESLLRLKYIYLTEYFRNKYEKKARQNIKHELQTYERRS